MLNLFLATLLPGQLLLSFPRASQLADTSSSRWRTSSVPSSSCYTPFCDLQWSLIGKTNFPPTTTRVLVLASSSLPGQALNDISTYTSASFVVWNIWYSGRGQGGTSSIANRHTTTSSYLLRWTTFGRHNCFQDGHLHSHSPPNNVQQGKEAAVYIEVITANMY